MVDMNENVYFNHLFYYIFIFITLNNFIDIRNMNTSIFDTFVHHSDKNRKLFKKTLSLCYNLQQGVASVTDNKSIF